jgi:hypothetical protein
MGRANRQGLDRRAAAGAGLTCMPRVGRTRFERDRKPRYPHRIHLRAGVPACRRSNGRTPHRRYQKSNGASPGSSRRLCSPLDSCRGRTSAARIGDHRRCADRARGYVPPRPYRSLAAPQAASSSQANRSSSRTVGSELFLEQDRSLIRGVPSLDR